MAFSVLNIHLGMVHGSWSIGVEVLLPFIFAVLVMIILELLAT